MPPLPTFMLAGKHFQVLKQMMQDVLMNDFGATYAFLSLVQLLSATSPPERLRWDRFQLLNEPMPELGPVVVLEPGTGGELTDQDRIRKTVGRETLEAFIRPLWPIPELDDRKDQFPQSSN